MKKLYRIIGLIILIGVIAMLFIPNNVKNFSDTYGNHNLSFLEIFGNGEISLKKGDLLKLNVRLNNSLYTSNKMFDWSSSNDSVIRVSDEGIVRALNSGSAVVTVSRGREVISIPIKVFDVRDVLIVVGDSRMDHFKDDNEFESTDKYEIKYKDITNIASHYDRFYVVSLSGMRYDWFAGIGSYKKNNATKYVRDLIEEYEKKSNEYLKYRFKILFNLGVNDLNHKYLDGSSRDVALKYLNQMEKVMDNEWSSDILYDISLNMITLFPVQDEMIDCYFPGRYDKDVQEFNKTLIQNSNYTVCDAYHDIDFKDNSFRKRTDKSCAKRDGLHFSEEFNKDILYDYLVDVCAKK